MQFPSKFKYFWWVLLLSGTGFLIYLRHNDIITGNIQSFDTLLLAITATLILIPFFSELTLLGVTLKQQVEETKKEIKQDLKEQVYNLRSDLQNLVNVNNHMNSQVVVGSVPLPPADNQLPALEQQIKEILTAFKKELGLNTPPHGVKDLIPSENIVIAFSSRYQVEREVRRIWNSRFTEQKEKRIRHQPLTRVVDDLVRADIIPSAVGRSIREVYSIGSPAVHGEEPSQEQIAFLSDVAPTLVETLKNIA
jgi:hypothetical protein